MTGLYYAFLILGFACTLAITLLTVPQGGTIIPSKPWYRKPLAILALATLFVYPGLAITGYVDNKRAMVETQGLEKRVESLDNKSRALEESSQALEEQNRALTDQIGDCNARVEALAVKFRSSAHFKRGIPEKVTTTDSITARPKR